MQRKTILIIKHGFSETCDHGVSPVVSYGDVYRCTCLLEDLRDRHVTWITAHAARDLLIDNHLIDRLILADTPDELGAGELPGSYDAVVNLEKQRDWCEYAAALEAHIRYGFKAPTGTGPDCFYPASAAALENGLQRGELCLLQETLFQTVGRVWQGQRYVLGYRPHVEEIYDVGLNHHVGPKWPTKAWPREHWRQLHQQLSHNYALCWQQSLNSVRHYIDWIASCRLIVTSDSLGLHLALGLNKKVVALFGPTPPEQVYMYGCGVKLTPVTDRTCLPCFHARCPHDETCMAQIPVALVAEAVEDLLRPTRTTAPTTALVGAAAPVPEAVPT